MDNLKRIAEEALNTFEVIADAATARLHEKGVSLASLASVNEATAESIARDMRERNVQRISDSMHLRREPTIARLVVADEDGLEEIIYISPVGTVDATGIKSCSYLSPKGRLASLPVGQGDEIPLPGGRRWFEVVEKMTFQPAQWAGDWDSRPAVEFRERAPARTIKSLRELLLSRIAPEADVDVLSQWLSEDNETESGLIVDGIVRETLTAMQLRVKHLLDQFQDSILRLPLDSRIAVLGPPGTGKTTTMIKRLRRTVDVRHLEEDEQQSVLDPDHRREAVSLAFHEPLLSYRLEGVRRGILGGDPSALLLQRWIDPFGNFLLRLVTTDAGFGKAKLGPPAQMECLLLVEEAIPEAPELRAVGLDDEEQPLRIAQAPSLLSRLGGIDLDVCQHCRFPSKAGSIREQQ